MRRCICQICICGRHHCEHTAKRRVPFAKDDDTGLKTTEHKDRFRPFGFQPRQKPVIPAGGVKWKGDEPTVKQSITKKDFVPFPIKKRSLIRPKETRVPKGNMADLCTTYQKDYVPKKGLGTERVNIPEPEGKDGIMPGTLPGKMERETTYNRCYTPKPFWKTEKASGKECTLTEFGKPFTGITETALQYRPHPHQKRDPVLPKKGTLHPGGDFSGTTTHQADFPPKYVVPERPCKKTAPSRWRHGDGKFESTTTHKHDYKCPVSAKRAVTCAPKSEIPKSGGPFKGKSHYKQDFQPYEVSQRELPKWHPLYLPFKVSSMPFEGESTYRTDYEPPPEDFSQYGAVKPLKGNLTLPTGPMEKLTTSMRDYRKICCPVPTKSFKPTAQYERPKEKFAGNTISRTDYTPKKREKPVISKAADNLKPGKGPMDDMTMTMKDFQWLAIECPAAYLKLFGKDALPNYEFEKREGGHDYFKKLKNKKDAKKTPIAKQDKPKKLLK